MTDTDTSKQLLIIDDDPVFCQLLKRGLERRGYRVGMAHDADAALQQAKQQQPDHILLDLRLADDSGLQLIKPLLKIRSDCQIIVITGYASLATAVQAVKDGAVNYIAKPVDVATVAGYLSEACDQPTSAAEIEQSPTSLKRLEWEHIQRVLNDNDGNISATARQLNMHRRTLQRKLQKKPQLS
ncbi:MAG: response regulator [Chromatiales bacterium]|jgi:two-component system response regulator RegA